MKMPGAMKTIIKWGAATAALVMLLAWFAGAMRTKIQPGHEEAEVRKLAPGQATEPIHCILDRESVEVTGTLAAVQRTEISARLVARIEDIAVRARDKVAKGQLLARLDARDIKARLEQARQQVSAAKASLDQTSADLKRYEGLRKNDVISGQEYDARQTAYRVAKADYARAQQAVNEAESSLEDTRILSPVAGVVVDRLAEPGDMATVGRPLLTIYDPNALRLEAAVPEALAQTIRTGQTLRIVIDSLGETLAGTVDEIVPQAEAASRSVLVKVRAPAREGMVEGMFGRLMIPGPQRQRYCMPQSAVQRAGQLTFADVATSGGLLVRRQIKLGDHREAGRIEVISGLEPGERVVLYGPAPPPFQMPEGRVLVQ